MKYESDHTMKNIADLDQDVDVINNTKSTSHYVPWPKIYRKFDLEFLVALALDQHLWP